ncbi:MAG: aldehyde ferredoxin oxidoreductase C-terminal domain-containing protein, partial [Burkholderiaceae bacterium]
VTEELYARQIDAAVGGGWTAARMRETGERIWNMERQFNLAAGLTRQDDTLPNRLLTEPAPSGTAKGLVARIPEMLPEYYQLRGWTADGVPTPQTLTRLGLAQEAMQAH